LVARPGVLFKLPLESPDSGRESALSVLEPMSAPRLWPSNFRLPELDSKQHRHPPGCGGRGGHPRSAGCAAFVPADLFGGNGRAPPSPRLKRQSMRSTSVHAEQDAAPKAGLATVGLVVWRSLHADIDVDATSPEAPAPSRSPCGNAGLPAGARSIFMSPPIASFARAASLGSSETAVRQAPHRRWARGGRLGQGGFGSVFRALDLDTSQLFAVREVVGPVDARLRARIDDCISFRHPNLLRYLGQAEIGGTYCVFTDYLAGGSLAAALRHLGALSGPPLCRIVRETLGALNYLHNQKPRIVHGSVKCASIFLDAAMSVKLGDYGFAATGARLQVQSLPWTAPEVVQGGRRTRKADVWSLGCAVLEMIAAETPWSSASTESAPPVARVMRAADMDPPLPASVCARCSDFISCCLQRVPEARIPTRRLLQHIFLSPAPHESNMGTAPPDSRQVGLHVGPNRGQGGVTPPSYV